MARLAVITGTSRGLGAAAVAEFDQAGWDVVAIRRTPDAGPSRGSGRVTTVIHDVGQPVSGALLDAVGDSPVDALINNAAIGAPPAGLAEVDPESILRAVDTNVVGPLRLVQALLPSLLLADRPSVFNISSRLGSVSAQADGQFADLATSYAYRVSKAALNMLTVALAAELPEHVRCWAVHPGVLATAMGALDAATSPAVAAGQLRRLVEDPDPASPRFVSLDGPDLAW